MYSKSQIFFSTSVFFSFERAIDPMSIKDKKDNDILKYLL